MKPGNAMSNVNRLTKEHHLKTRLGDFPIAAIKPILTLLTV